MQPGGQSIVDRLLAAKNTIAGQTVAKIVCKATTEEILGPKRKHLDCLLQATHEMNISIPEIADLLIERSQNSSWVVSFKSLITIHHLMSYGNERFEAYMASHNRHLQSDIYIDRTVMTGNDMSVHIRRYAHYLNEKREAYKILGYDFCKIKRGKDDGFLRTMVTDKLLKALPILLKVLDAIVHFEISANELINGVINSCFFLLVKDLIHLYAALNEGMINLLEKYFDMNKKQCREGLDLYKKFLDRTDQVTQFLKIAETSGMEKCEIPELSRAPNSLLEALENHLAHIEGKKVSSQTLITKQQFTEHGLKFFPTDFVINTNDDPQKILEEEAKALAKFNKQKELPSPTPSPFVTTQSTTNTNQNGFETDFFSEKSSSNPQQPLFNDDLFSLATPSTQTVTNTFTNVFDTSANNHILQPTTISTNKTVQPINQNNITITTTTTTTTTTTKPLQSGDLNSSLNQLIDNLNIKDHSKIGKDHQWTAADVKNQQIIGMNTSGMMNTSGTTWPNPPTINAAYSGMNLPSNNNNNIWQPIPTMTNPFAASNGATTMNNGGFNSQSMSMNTNPFAAQTFYGNSIYNQQNQQPVNDPFGSL